MQQKKTVTVALIEARDRLEKEGVPVKYAPTLDGVLVELEAGGTLWPWDILQIGPFETIEAAALERGLLLIENPDTGEGESWRTVPRYRWDNGGETLFEYSHDHKGYLFAAHRNGRSKVRTIKEYVEGGN
ncbi:MAG: hypothetical protein RBR08_16670 [Desulforegulaceae bacterium]|nr:hypothetical protein [Desulforegulaceae bacterium]